jgi:pimeloyl-ACP methyl ester carboxylesterase
MIRAVQRRFAPTAIGFLRNPDRHQFGFSDRLPRNRQAIAAPDTSLDLEQRNMGNGFMQTINLVLLLNVGACGQQPFAWRDPSPHITQFVTGEEGVRLEVSIGADEAAQSCCSLDRAFQLATKTIADRWSAKLIKAVPSAKLIDLPCAGHFVFLTRENEVISGIREFIAGPARSR